jgi:hypothetical protein
LQEVSALFWHFQMVEIDKAKGRAQSPASDRLATDEIRRP